MTYKVKDAIIIVIVMVLVVATVPVVSVDLSFGDNPAPTITTEKLSVDNVPSLKETTNLLSGAAEDIEITKQLKNEIVYDVELADSNGGTIDSHIEAEINSAGDQVLQITEGEVETTLVYCENGDILIDGEPIVVTTEYVPEKSESSFISINENAVAHAAQRMSWEKNVPYGNVADYSILNSTTKKKLTLSKTISAMAVAAIVLVILSALAVPPVAAGLISIAIAGLQTWFSSNDAKAKAFSLVDKRCTHRTKGVNVKSGLTVYKHIFVYYANTDYTGTISSSTLYQIWRY